ncbi:PEP/pyruvate-binding domain-containing protein [Streptomyces sp. TRM68416]|uniref:PEP/pyruvate-binding domain-containing protein n=1 Tax=Streptomyces sp. TRM68416 TaxID=2758412 RepID=UPI001661E807|nr:PEP/pyruvate-binding domain-containing protein [Streptomyces sp. TRM68416]MBD0844524.1 pyruvate phosphate dikinase [Streptomyces sp. TRM68416]
MTTLDERHGEGAYKGEGSRGETALGLVAEYAPAAVPLEQPLAAVPGTAGSKAANLARAAGAGLPVLPGFVIPYKGKGDPDALRRAWQEVSGGGARPLVVRSSSPQEDTEESSLAGQFASVLDVRGWADFHAAVRTVIESARRSDGSTAPMAVLVQPMLRATVGGVMFGADPVEGRADRMLVSAVRGGPDSLVSGEQAGTNYWLSGRGRVLRTEPEETGALLGRGELRRLARLARRARQVFGGPQDIEFGFDADGRLWLFQSRPITAMAGRPPRGARLLGPGPVAETLPDQLQPLEEDLWVTPMARGLAAALDIGGTAPRRLLRSAPVVTTVGGRAAGDLRLLGAVPPKHPWLSLLNPAPGARRLAAAWRVGRLTAALPGLATDLVADVDRHLAEVPAPAGLPAAALADELRWTRSVLVSLHAQEALAGALLRDRGSGSAAGSTAAGTALAALAAARARGAPDERVIADRPVVLALTAPTLRGRVRLPSTAPAGRDGTPASPSSLPPREALRLRVRWIQELQVRLVRDAGRRLGLPADRIGLLRWRELVNALDGEALPADLDVRMPPAASPPLPDAFRLAEGGAVVAERTGRRGDRVQGVSGGRAVGTAWDGTGSRPEDAVLVVRTLDPALAPLLPGLTGLVAQTGSPLSHLAVLAREFGLPAVVGAEDAVGRFPVGARLTVDGTAGDVRLGAEP